MKQKKYKLQHMSENLEETQREAVNEPVQAAEAAQDKPEATGDVQASAAESAKAEEAAAEESRADALQAQIAQLNDRYLRLSAEFDNYRKRTIREKADLIQAAGADVLKDFLAVVDDFERGLKAMESTDDMVSIQKGMNLVYSKMKDFLQRNGVKEIAAVGEPFDTDRHEALTKIPAPDAAQRGRVVDVVTKGYMLHDKVLRFAKVVVGE